MATKESRLLFNRPNFWEEANPKTIKEAFSFSENYKNFLNNAKTEKQVINECIKSALKKGFKISELNIPSANARDNKKFIFINRNKSAIFVSLGKKKLVSGANFIIAHVDAPHLDLKVRPLYEDSGIAYFKPHYYGGIKKYHWPAIPLSLHGTVILKNGQEIEINIGNKDNDQIFVISDLLPHLDSDRLDRPLNKAVEAEDLNIIVGSIPVKNKKIKTRVKLTVLEWLNKNYQMDEEDLFTADLRFVPAWSAKDVGFDRSLVASYGQDDRACVYTGFQAFLDAKNEQQTKICYLVDKEEIGSVGTTSADSNFLENSIEHLISLTNSSLSVNDFLRLSQGVSADTTAAFDPDYKSVYDPHNSIHLGKGVAIEKYLGRGGKYFTIEAEPIFIRKILNIFKKNNIIWQTGHLGKVDQGGGGSIAGYLARRNMEIVDMGPPLLNLHSPCELSSKADIYSAYRAYKVFMEN